MRFPIPLDPRPAFHKDAPTSFGRALTGLGRRGSRILIAQTMADHADSGADPGQAAAPPVKLDHPRIRRVIKSLRGQARVLRAKADQRMGYVF